MGKKEPVKFTLSRKNEPVLKTPRVAPSKILLSQINKKCDGVEMSKKVELSQLQSSYDQQKFMSTYYTKEEDSKAMISH